MGKKLIITEKPSVAQEYAKVFGVSGRKNGYIEDDKYVITWCVGHLVEMVYPEEYDMKYKKWALEDLPFLPAVYKYGVIKSVSGQYEIVHHLLHREDIDTVYWAGDSGKEGQTIEENIRNYGGVREGMKELRVWIDSQTEEEIRRGVAEAKPMSEYANLGFSGIMRSIEDYAMGINFSRVMSVKYGKLLNDAAATKSYTAIAVGRVMTCVLGMVVQREREIRNFNETFFYRIIGRFTDVEFEAEWKTTEDSKYFESPKLYKENGFKKEEDAKAFIESLEGKEAVISDLAKGISKKKAPLLFNLAELQAECAKRFKISPEETLQIAQELYEKKLTTYPRTDARVLTTAVAKEIGKTLYKIVQYEPTKKYCEEIIQKRSYFNLAQTQYTDDNKVTDHYAIIPTGQLTELQSLTSLQREVFDLIVRRFLSIFYAPAEYDTVKMTIKVDTESFFASARVLKTLGYLEVMGKSFEEDENTSLQESNENASGEDSYHDKLKNGKKILSIVDTLHMNDVIPLCGYELKESKTSPPKRYTTGTMILAMENAGQLIEEEELREQIKGSGIGTSATRAGIIDKLIRIGYLHCNKKTQVLSPENFGEMVYEVVAMTVPALLNPKMTASWEKGLDGITNGTVNMAEYRVKLENFIRKETVQIRDNDLTRQLANLISQYKGEKGRGLGAKKKIGVSCPVCGGDIITTPFGYGCSNYNREGTGCKFVIGTIAGRDLTEEECLCLLRDGHTQVLSGFVGKNKKKFQAALVLDKNEEGRMNISFDFSKNQPQVLEDVVCPLCGGEIVQTPFGYGCTNYEKDNPDSCRFSIGKMAGKEIPKTQIRELLLNGRTDTIRGFIAKNGKKFDARILLDRDENNKVVGLKFSFDDIERQKIKDVACPLCGGEIIKTPFGFGCINYSKDDENSCRFSIGKMAGKDLTETSVKELLTEGRTSTLRGFKGKSGKKFDARVVLAKDEQGKVTGLKFDFNDLEQPKLKDAKCPLCGGDIVKTLFGYGCSNYNKDDEDHSCRFSISKISGVKLNDSQVRQLLATKKTDVITGFTSKNGSKFDAPLKLTEQGQIVFDFPKRPDPTDTNVTCPRCKEKLLKKSQWYYECDCGFKLGHTVAQVPISEELLKELLETGKSKCKITGFVSKAGNAFETYLKYEDERISFDFDRTDEETGAKENETMPWLNENSEQNVQDQNLLSEETPDDKESPIEDYPEEMMLLDEQMAMEQVLYEQSLAGPLEYDTIQEDDLLPWS